MADIINPKISDRFHHFSTELFNTAIFNKSKNIIN